MQKADVTQLASAVVTHLATGTFAMPVVAERKYRRDVELVDAARWHCSVLTTEGTSEPITRSSFDDRYVIAILSQKQAREDADIDALVYVMQQIRDRMRDSPLVDLPGMKAILWEWNPLYDPAKLQLENVFQSLLKVTFRGVTT